MWSGDAQSGLVWPDICLVRSDVGWCGAMCPEWPGLGTCDLIG